VIASAVVGTAGRFLLQTYAQSLATHSHGVVIRVLEPVWVALFAAGWFSESMSTTQLAGCGLIFLALLINRWGVLSKAIKGWARKQKTA
jgi:drug/metabolite transporter (DMT)-like permease